MPGREQSRLTDSGMSRSRTVGTKSRIAEGQIAVVTGAGSGIGRAIASCLNDSGVRVLGCGRGEPRENLETEIHWRCADVSRPDDIRSLGRTVAQMPGRLGILVNNAGIQLEKNIVATTDDDWSMVMGTNCRGVFNACREFIPIMESLGGGVIVNIGSISGNFADPGLALYNASKGFVHALTRSIAVDHGPLIRCNAVSPGWIMTEMAQAAFQESSDVAQVKADALARHPVGRLGLPADIANMVRWLVSDDASFVTGQCMTVDGGLTAASPIRTDLY